MDLIELKPEQKYLFTEFPHGVFPMGQWLSQSISELIAPGNRYCKGNCLNSSYSFYLFMVPFNSLSLSLSL